MAHKLGSLSEKEIAIAGAAIAGLAAAGALLWSRRARDEAPDEPRTRRDANGEVNFVDDGVQGY